MALVDDRVWFGETGGKYGSGTVGLRSVRKSGGAVTAIENQIFVNEIVTTGAEVVVSGFTSTNAPSPSPRITRRSSG